jgi:uncharacterized membrane protein YoaK (UPF0700 family)
MPFKTDAHAHAVKSDAIPSWVALGAFLLSLIGGLINVVGLLGFEQQAITHLTGTTTQLAVAAATCSLELTYRFGLILLSFVFGAVLSGWLIGKNSAKLGRRYGVALMFESGLLWLASALLIHNSFAGVYFACAACGLQNAMVTTYSGAVIRTTHLSGMFTDLGIYLGHAARGLPVNWLRLKICCLVIGGFFLGSLVGAWSFARFGNRTLYLPATLTGITAAAYYGFESWTRFQAGRARD